MICPDVTERPGRVRQWIHDYLWLNVLFCLNLVFAHVWDDAECVPSQCISRWIHRFEYGSSWDSWTRWLVSPARLWLVWGVAAEVVVWGGVFQIGFHWCRWNCYWFLQGCRCRCRRLRCFLVWRFRLCRVNELDSKDIFLFLNLLALIEFDWGVLFMKLWKWKIMRIMAD